MEPLVFDTYCRPQPWGGRRLAEFGKPLPPDGTFGEAWELSGQSLHVSRVAEGPLAGRLLTDLWAERNEELAGPGRKFAGPFPLLIKYLDCQELLSIQVHPSDQIAREMGCGEMGKTEAWLVLDAAPRVANLRRVPARRRPRRGRAPPGRRHAGPMPALVRAAAGQHGLPGGRHCPCRGRRRAHCRSAAVERYDLPPLRLEPARPRWPAAGPAQGRGPAVDQLGHRAGRSAGGPAAAGFARGHSRRRAGPLRLFFHGPIPAGSAVGGAVARRMSIWMVLEGSAQLTSATSGYGRVFRRGATVLVPASAAGLSWRPIGGEAVLLGTVLLPLELEVSNRPS